MPRKRDHIRHDVELAAALLLYRDSEGKPWIPYEHAKAMTPDQVISLFQRQHNILHTHDGPDTHWNIEWMPLMLHRERTAKIDIPVVAKVRANRTKDAIHRAAMASKSGDYAGAARILAAAPKPPVPKRKIQSRGFPQGHRPMRSRSSFQGSAR